MEEAIPKRSRLLGVGRRSSVTATEPAWVFALKSLLHPVIVVACLACCLAYWRESLHGPYFLIAVLAFLASAETLDVFQPYHLPSRHFALEAFINVLLRWMVVVAFVWALLRLSRLGYLFQYNVLISWALVTPVALFCGDSAARRLLARQGTGAPGIRKAVIIGLRLEQRLQRDPSLRMQVAGYFEDRKPDRLPAEGVDRILGRPAELPEFVRQNDIKVAYVTLPMTQQPRLLDLLSALRDSTVSVYFVPNLSLFELLQARLDVIGGMPVVAVCESPFFGGNSIAKRLFDVVIASSLMVLLAPLLLLISFGVSVSSPGPVIFKQRRYGLDGRQILVYKFRSMTVTEDGHTQYQQVGRGDPRVTRFGAWIRRLSLDELPQLFNVIVGSLSLVGPRPHAIAVNEQYRKLIPGYMLRHKVKPGITGWAQVNGYRGGDDLESMRKRIQYDIEYLRHWSLALDLAILMRTVVVVWNDKGAY